MTSGLPKEVWFAKPAKKKKQEKKRQKKKNRSLESKHACSLPLPPTSRLRKPSHYHQRQ
jgi:hypothetical protein